MKLSMNFRNFTVNDSARIICKKTVIARPANVVNAETFGAMIENATIDRCIDYCVDKSIALRALADETKNDDTRARRIALADEFDANVDALKKERNDDAPDYEHTLAQAVAYTLNTKMRGTKADTRTYTGFYEAFDMARDLARRGATSNKAIQPLADALRKALNTAIENDGNGDDITKRFKARVNVDMARNLIYGAGYEKYGNMSRAGIPIHTMDIREFTVQALNMCFEKTFDFTDVKRLRASSRTEF